MIWLRVLWGVVALALALAWGITDLQTGLVWCVGCLLGWMLVHYQFGFAEPFRRLIRERDPRALSPLTALIVVLLLGSALLRVLPEPLNLHLKFSRAPISLTLLAGAFLFGVGMQMAGRCTSGTLASAGRGGRGFLFTLIGLIIGVFVGSLQRSRIEEITPSLPSLALTDSLSVGQAVIVQLALLSLVLAIVNLWCGANSKLASRQINNQSFWLQFKPSFLVAGGILLMLIVSGEPWKVLWGFALTGAHIAKLFGWDASTSTFWSVPSRAQLIADHWNWIRHDAVVVDLALVFGALSAQAWQSRAPSRAISKSSRESNLFLRFAVLRFISGGLLMGFGGFLAYGCNISGFLGGIQSFSVHGWLWLAAALVGSWSWLALDRHLARLPLVSVVSDRSEL